MPVNVRKDGKARRIALQILGPPACGLADSFGNKKRFVRKKEKKDAEKLYQEKLDGEKINDLQEAGYRW
jgi:hypothetical protein